MEVDDMLIQRMRLWRLVPSLYGHPSSDALSYRFQRCRAVPGRKRNRVGLPLSRSSMSSSPRTHPPFRITQDRRVWNASSDTIFGLLNILDPNANFAQMWQKMIVTLIVSTPASSKVLEKEKME